MIARRFWGGLLKDTRGEAGLVEWVIIVITVAVFCITIFRNIGSSVSAQANSAATAIGGLSNH
jgi:hypothetical protein